MSTVAPSNSQRSWLATEPQTSQAWWFLDTMDVARKPERAPRFPLVTELIVPPGGSPPRHVHEDLNAAFFLLEGEVVLSVGGLAVVARPSTYTVVPVGSDHTFRSPAPRRWECSRSTTTTTRTWWRGCWRRTRPGLCLVRCSRCSDRSIIWSWRSRIYGAARPGTPGPSVWSASMARSPRTAAAISRWSARPVAGCSPSARLPPRLLDMSPSPVLTALRWWPGATHSPRRASPGTITDAPYGSGFVLGDLDGLELVLFAPPST